MWYFAYDHLSDQREMIRFYRDVPPRVPLPLSRQPAVLRNHRLCFPRYSETFGGGIASVVESAGKSVSGVLYDLPRRAVELLDEHYDGRLASICHKRKQSRRIGVEVYPLAASQPFAAVTHQLLTPPGEHFPPSSQYIDLLVRSAMNAGLSSLWVEHLRSFVPPSRELPTPRVRPSSIAAVGAAI